RHEHELLVDDRNPGLLRVARAPEASLLAAHTDAPAVALARIHAGEDLEEGRLPGAVLTADRVDLSATRREARAAQRVHTPERLVDAGELQDHRRRRRQKRTS